MFYDIRVQVIFFLGLSIKFQGRVLIGLVWLRDFYRFFFVIRGVWFMIGQVGVLDGGL